MSEEKEYRIRSAISARAQSGTGALEYKYNSEKLQQENRYKVDGDPYPEKLNKFNWGACIITPFWGLGNNTPIACLSFVLGFVPYIGLFLVLGFSIYCGIKGNEWAWKNKEWVDMRQFHEVQRKWAIAGIILELVTMLVVLIISFTIVDKLLNYSSSF